MNKKFFSVAIDGPSAAGKSTIAKSLATDLNFIYIDTGALYRAIGCHALECNASTTSIEEITPLLKDIKVELLHIDGVQRVFLNGVDVSEKIRLPEMSMAASNVSALPPVRAFLMDLQRDIAKKYSVVMDGRDIATVVLPSADIKFFLTATPEERAKRRFLEFEAKGIKVDFDTLLKETLERDYNDSNRAIAPLKPHEQSVIIDSTNMNLDEVTACMTVIVKEKLNALVL